MVSNSFELACWKNDLANPGSVPLHGRKHFRLGRIIIWSVSRLGILWRARGRSAHQRALSNFSALRTQQLPSIRSSTPLPSKNVLRDYRAHFLKLHQPVSPSPIKVTKTVRILRVQLDHPLQSASSLPCSTSGSTCSLGEEILASWIYQGKLGYSFNATIGPLFELDGNALPGRIPPSSFPRSSFLGHLFWESVPVN